MKALMIVVVLLAMMVGPAMAVAIPPLTGTLLGNNDQLELRVGYRPDAGKSEIGLSGLWMDGLNGTVEGYGLAAYATYDVISNLEIPWTLPWITTTGKLLADGYLGARVGFITPRDGEFDPDASAALLGGIRFGGPKVQIGVEYQANLTKDLWSSLADVSDSRVVASVSYHF